MLHKSIWFLTGAVCILLPYSNVYGQLPIDGFYPEKGKITFAATYTGKNYDEFYLGSTLNEDTPIGGEITSNIISVYGQYAFNDWLSASVTLPYIRSESEEGNPDPVQESSEVDGIQDLGIYGKARLLQRQFGDSKLDLGGFIGITFPIGDYEGGGVLSLGNEATTFNGGGIVQYTLPFNLFAEAALAYSARTSSDFDIPDAVLYSTKLGYYNQFLYVHAKLEVQNSTSGLDIGTPAFGAAGGPAALPETDVDFTDLSFTAYVPVFKNQIGLSATYATTLDGRNYANESSFSFGLVYTSK